MSRFLRDLLIRGGLGAGVALFVGGVAAAIPSADRCAVRTAEQDLDRLAEAVALHTDVVGHIPRSLADVLPDGPAIDPWGAPYWLAWRDRTLTVGTFGADGRNGGLGPDADRYRPVVGVTSPTRHAVDRPQT